MKPLRYIVLVVYCYLAGMTLSAFGCDDQPEAADIFTELKNRWVDGDYEAFGEYLFTRQSECSDYVPTMIAHAWYLGVFEGKVDQGITLLRLVRSRYSLPDRPTLEKFIGKIDKEIADLQEILDELVSRGVSGSEIEMAASPSTVRSEWGDAVPFGLMLIYWAPSERLPSAQ